MLIKREAKGNVNDIFRRGQVGQDKIAERLCTRSREREVGIKLKRKRRDRKEKWWNMPCLANRFLPSSRLSFLAPSSSEHCVVAAGPSVPSPPG